MVENSCISVLDVGKTSVKLVVLDEQAAILNSSSCDNQVLHADPYPHFDIEKIWNWLLNTLNNISNNYLIRGIVVSTHGACAALMGGDHLAMPILDYEYSEIDEVSKEYDLEARYFSETYSPKLPNGLNLGRQFYWQKQHFPELFKNVDCILLYPQYWTFRLSGVKASECTSLGCHTDLWLPQQQQFSPFAVKMGWDQLFPAILPAWQRLGPLKKELVEVTGLPEDCQIFNGVHDSNASYLRHKVSRSADFSVVSTGTWVVCMTTHSDLSQLREQQDTLVNVDVFGEPVACSQFMGGREFSKIRGEEVPNVLVTESEISYILDNSIFAVPSFAEKSGPFPYKAGKILGTLPEMPEFRYGLASLYYALMTDYCLTMLNSKGDILIEGSAIQNKLFCQIIATIRSPQIVHLSQDLTGTVVGTSLLTRWPVEGYFPETEECAPHYLFLKEKLDQYQKAWLSLCLQ